ncbi:hypothetical protein [Actinoplanes sp. NPDC051411]|uniref:hypothetical protein n=1 Tax=Actinoplanes sp. NPDC051411 TaxID=3155522 RepID=UPI0034179FD0
MNDTDGGGTYTLPAPPAGDPAALYRYADELDACAADFDGLAGSTRSTTADVRDRAQWSGDAAEAYTSFSTAVGRPVGEASARLRALAAAARRHAAVLSAAQQKVAAANQAAMAATPQEVPTAAVTATTAAELAQREVDGSGTAETAEAEETEAWYKTWWEESEPVRAAIEKVLAPLDLVLADKWLSVLREHAAQPGEWLEDIDDGLKEVEELQSEGKLSEAGAKLIAMANQTEKAGDDFADLSGLVRTASGNLGAVRGISTGLGALGLVADVGIEIEPPDQGARGTVDRVVAGANAAGITTALIAANASADWIPGVGEVVAGATGLYLAGDFVYDHRQQIAHVASAAGHATVSVAKGIGHAIVKGLF